MFRSKALISMMAVGGMFLVTQQAGAVIVPTATDDNLWDNGLILDETSTFEFGGTFRFEAIADSDSNEFLAIGMAEVGGAGWANHIDINAIKFANGGSLTEGMAVRMSAWVMSNPNDPFANPAGLDGFKMEFLNFPLGDGTVGSPDLITDTEVGMGLGLIPVGGAPLLTTGWTQKSFTVELTDAVHNFAALQEIRPVMFEGGAVGSTGEIFVDNYMFEVFPDLATANATPLPGSTPGGFDVPIPVDLSGDINGDGFVGIADLNIVLGNWNAGIPPAAAAAGAPVLLSDFSNFSLTGVYVNWETGVFTSGATDFRIEGGDFGGGWLDLAAPIDATDHGRLEVQLDVNVANVADIFNIVLIDADGTERVIRFNDVTIGDDQTLIVNLIDFLQDNQVGTVPGLDLANLVTFHIQGPFNHGNPGLHMDLTIDNLALLLGGLVALDGDINGDGFVGIADLNIVLGTWNNGVPPPAGGANVPEPATLSLLALGGLAMLRRRSA